MVKLGYVEIEVPSRAAAYSHYILTVHKAILHCNISICGLRNLISHVPTAVTAIFAFASTQTEWSILETAYVKLFVFALITLNTKKVSWQHVIGSPSLLVPRPTRTKDFAEKVHFEHRTTNFTEISSKIAPYEKGFMEVTPVESA